MSKAGHNYAADGPRDSVNHLATRLGGSAPIFVISSGRTGSTLLARQLNDHPEILVVSDIFEPGGVEPYFDREVLVDGHQLWAMLSRPSLPQRIKYWRDQSTDELLYLHPDDDKVSLLMSYTLPFLSPDPVALFNELAPIVTNFKTAPAPDLLLQFFDVLRSRFGRRVWVERTGGSLPHARSILEAWPDAVILHNVRDPVETAISMMTGSFFRLYLALSMDPDLGDWNSDLMPTLSDMGAMLNRWIVDGEQAFRQLPPERLSYVRYEDLVSDTSATLLSLIPIVLGRDVSPVDEDWALKQARGVRPVPLKFPGLHEDQQSALLAEVGAARDLLCYF